MPPSAPQQLTPQKDGGILDGALVLGTPSLLDLSGLLMVASRVVGIHACVHHHCLDWWWCRVERGLICESRFGFGKSCDLSCEMLFWIRWLSFFGGGC